MLTKIAYDRIDREKKKKKEDSRYREVEPGVFIK